MLRQRFPHGGAERRFVAARQRGRPLETATGSGGGSLLPGLTSPRRISSSKVRQVYVSMRSALKRSFSD